MELYGVNGSLVFFVHCLTLGEGESQTLKFRRVRRNILPSSFGAGVDKKMRIIKTQVNFDLRGSLHNNL